MVHLPGRLARTCPANCAHLQTYNRRLDHTSGRAANEAAPGNILVAINLSFAVRRGDLSPLRNSFNWKKCRQRHFAEAPD